MVDTAFRSGIRMRAVAAIRPAARSADLRRGAFATTTTTKAGKTTC